MTSIEERLRHALADEVTARPSPDLFARVAESVEDGRARRRARRRYVAGAAGVLILGTVGVLTLTPRENGHLAMDWWILELFTNAVLIAIALWLGPFIKRFGRAYAADVFHDNPQTGKSYIVLTDIVYYLIFTAYILFTVNFSAGVDWGPDVTGNQHKVETARIGGILLIIGVLHGLNIVLMPVLGRLFSLNRSLSGSQRRE
jgi:hypothetical protein